MLNYSLVSIAEKIHSDCALYALARKCYQECGTQETLWGAHRWQHYHHLQLLTPGSPLGQQLLNADTTGLHECCIYASVRAKYHELLTHIQQPDFNLDDSLDFFAGHYLAPAQSGIGTQWCENRAAFLRRLYADLEKGLCFDPELDFFAMNAINKRRMLASLWNQMDSDEHKFCEMVLELYQPKLTAPGG